MNTIRERSEEQEPLRKEQRPLAFTVRNQRQKHAPSGLSEDDLARLSGMTVKRLRRYEVARTLPDALKGFLRMAAALRVPLETLVDDRHLDEIRATVERRRQQRGETADDAEADGNRRAA